MAADRAGPRPPVLVVQHEDQCPPAWFGDWLEDAGCALDVRRPYAGVALPEDLSGYAGMLVLGGHMGADDDADFGWLVDVKHLVRSAVAGDVPLLGICLGHQLVAVALGGEVARNPRGQRLGLTPVGWHPDAAADPLFGACGAPARGVQWNDDIVVRLPSGAVALARTPDGDVQAARFAASAWGVQLHPEADAAVVSPWADADRPRYADGVVDRALAEVAAARDELEAAWRPLASAFARIVGGEGPGSAAVDMDQGVHGLEPAGAVDVPRRREQ